MSETKSSSSTVQHVNKRRKKDDVIHITPEEATQITGYDSKGFPVSQERKEEEENKLRDKKNGELLVTLCTLMRGSCALNAART